MPHGIYANGEGEVLVSTTSQVYHDGEDEVISSHPQILDPSDPQIPEIPGVLDPELTPK